MTLAERLDLEPALLLRSRIRSGVASSSRGSIQRCAKRDFLRFCDVSFESWRRAHAPCGCYAACASTPVSSSAPYASHCTCTARTTPAGNRGRAQEATLGTGGTHRDTAHGRQICELGMQHGMSGAVQQSSSVPQWGSGTICSAIEHAIASHSMCTRLLLCCVAHVS